MEMQRQIFSLLLGVILATIGKDVWAFEYEPFKGRLEPDNGLAAWMVRRLTTFSWKNCNKTAVPVSFSGLSIQPEPVQFGQNILISMSMDVEKEIGTTNTLNIDTEITMVMQGMTIKVCDMYPSYCHFDDLCKILSQYKDKCPDIIKKLGTDCTCPFKPKNYSVKDATYRLPSVPYAVEGTIHITVHLTEEKTEVGCLDMGFCIGSC